MGTGAKPAILILVEDDPNDFVLLKRALWKIGANVRVWWAKSSLEALGILNEVKSTGGRVCMVADVHLPGMDGFDLLKAVKARPGAPDVKFAFLTGSVDERCEARAQASGADAFFLKPSDWSGLVETARALQKLSARD